MPYFKDLSDNLYKIHNTYTTKGSVKSWMNLLADRILPACIPEAGSYRIWVKGYFIDRRHPDIHNLHKVIGDALKQVLPKDDKYYIFQDEESEIGIISEYIRIGIEPL